MGHTERRFLVATSIVFLLAASAAAGAAAPAASGGTTERSSASASPTTFAERVVAGGGQAGREAGSWQDTIELIVLAATCAIAVAFYAAATAQRTDSRVPVRVRRR